MPAHKRALLLTVCLAFGVLADAKSDDKKKKKRMRWADIQFLDEYDVDSTLAMESSNKVNATRLSLLEEEFRAMYAALPKGENGHLGQETVRYVLHRYFLNQRGWLVKGLDPEFKNFKAPTEQHQKDWQSWVPAYLQRRFEEQASKDEGTDLRDLAEMVMTIEDLVRKEAERQLAQVYHAVGKDVTQALDHTEALQVLDLYMVIMLTGRKMSLAGPVRNKKRIIAFQRKYSGYKTMHEWLRGVEEPFLGPNETADKSARYQFKTLSGVVETVTDEYPIFNDVECQELKSTLMQLEGGSKKAGRIPLGDFYRPKRIMHWNFSESPDYLRDLGVLDESDPRRPQVLLANYVSSYNNCMQASGLYAFCCRNPCEQLMTSLEQQVVAPSATAERLAAIVGNLSTNTVPARGPQLEGRLRERLEALAERSGGEVPLHGRLFAQWMHHAFPRECPYPFEAGATHPQTPAEWSEINSRTTKVSEEQIQEIVEGTCPSEPEAGQTPGCGSEDAELPWDDKEELLARVDSRHGVLALPADEEPTPPYYVFAAITSPVLLVGTYALDQKFASKGRQQRLKARLVMGMAALAGTSVALGLLDLRAVLGAGLLALLWRHFAVPCVAAPMQKKCDDCGV